MFDPDRIIDTAEGWFEGVAPTGLTGVSATAVKREFAGIVEAMASALVSEPFDPRVGEALGARLVALNYTDPQVVGHTAAMIATLPTLVHEPLSATETAVRLALLCGAVGQGYAAALHRVTVNGQARLHRAMLDVQEQISQQLRDADLRFELIVSHAAVAIGVTDIAGVLTYANPTLGQMLGRAPAELVGTRVIDNVHPLDREHIQHQYAAISAAQSGSMQIECRYLRADQRVGWSTWTVTAVRQSPCEDAYVFGVGQDITDRRRTDDELRHRALHDPLTGLPNRAHLLDTLDRALDPETPEVVGGVLYCDVAGFKVVNDDHGHSVGDLVLTAIAYRLQQAVGDDGMLARMGGDEFVVALTGTAADDRLLSVIERLHLALTQPITTPGEDELRLRVWIGATTIVHGDPRTPDEILHDADSDMYRRRGEDSSHR